MLDAPSSTKTGVGHSIQGLARSAAQYLSVRSRLAAAEAALEARRSTRALILLAGALLAALTGAGTLAAALVLWLELYTGSIVAAAGVVSSGLLLLAALAAWQGLKSLSSRRWFPHLRDELHRDAVCLTRNSESNP